MTDENLFDEYRVIFAPGYPDPVRLWPQTAEHAREFTARNGGTAQHRKVSLWRALDEEKGEERNDA